EPLSDRLLSGKSIRIALARVDEDGQRAPPRGASRRHAYPGPGLAGRLGGLPEDPLTSALDTREHQLRAVLAGPIEHQVDGHAAADARPHRHLLDDLGTLGPVLGAMAVDLGRSWPAVARLEHEVATRQRQSQQ